MVDEPHYKRLAKGICRLTYAEPLQGSVVAWLSGTQSQAILRMLRFRSTNSKTALIYNGRSSLASVTIVVGESP